MYRILIVLFSISSLNAQGPNDLGSLLYKEVTANVETEPVFAGDDAADDMCVLENKTDPDKSLIISSDKKYGIIVYNLEGKKLYNYPVGRVNNVDIIEIHNRPAYLKYFDYFKKRIVFYFHNDPLAMTGSISIKERNFILNTCHKIIFNSEWSKKQFLKKLDKFYHKSEKLEVIHQSINKEEVNINKKEMYIKYIPPVFINCCWEENNILFLFAYWIIFLSSLVCPE